MSKRRKLTKKQLILKVGRIVRRYGRVTLLVQELGTEEPCSCLCKKCKANFAEPDRRRRIIDKNGNCKVSYKHSSSMQWSCYETSCFMDDYGYRAKRTPEKTMKLMLDHDQYEDWEVIMLEYGPRFSKKIKL